MRARNGLSRGARFSSGAGSFLGLCSALLLIACDENPTAPEACVGECGTADAAVDPQANAGDAGGAALAPGEGDGNGAIGRTFPGPDLLERLPEGASGADVPSANAPAGQGGDMFGGDGAARGGDMAGGPSGGSGSEDGPVEPGGRGGDGTGTGSGSGAGDDPVNPNDPATDPNNPGGSGGMPAATCPPAWDPGLMTWLVTREGVDGLVLRERVRSADDSRQAMVVTGTDDAPALHLRQMRVLADGLRAVAIGADTEDVGRNNALHLVNLARGEFIDVVPWRAGLQGIVLPQGDEPVELAGLAVTADGRYALTWWHVNDTTSLLGAADLSTSEPVDLVGDGSNNLLLARIADVAVDRAGRIYVAHAGVDALSILGLDTAEPILEVPVEIGRGDHDITAIAPAYDGRHVFLAIGRHVARLDVGALLADEDPQLLFLDVRPHGRYSGEAIGLSPSTANPDEVFAVVRSDWGLDRADRHLVDVAAISVDGLRVRWRLELRKGEIADRSAWSAVAAADGETLYVARNNSGEVMAVDVPTGAVRAVIDHVVPVRDVQVLPAGGVELDAALGEACVAPGKTAFGHPLAAPEGDDATGGDGLGGDLEGVELAPGEGGGMDSKSRDAGCGCDVGAPGASASPWLFLLFLAAGLRRRRT